ncbi:MAG: tRNA uridine-5-carboxymethylaminomethyl(34) synthesis enzyme MnmG, partial [Clostridia bacterium]|nr:tRNA uridine-5-carboxymethylaminomethyl(34) synthesis enzyme MnmG [Clostridia bacterium]
KGHLVYEIDALGGEMGRAADVVTLQSRTLNLGKGAAVHSKRVQADRILYRNTIKKVLENTENLSLIQAEIISVETEKDTDGKDRVVSVTTSMGAVWEVSAAIICSGTFLDSRTITGEAVCKSGPDGLLPALGLSDCLRALGVSLMRFKTGTPPRIHADSIDYSVLEIQNGEYGDECIPFSVLTDPDAYANMKQIPCHIAYTNEETHRIIRENLHRSPLYSGVIEGTGPRYCPSIEDKVVRFSDKIRHQLFVEPCGADTKEIYLQGFSSSLPEEVQMRMLHSIKGFENARVMRTAYAIEYDCIDPTQLFATLEFKDIHGLYGAGQFNGSSGYEEAAAQGLIAGINASLSIKGEKPLVLSRDSSYIGTLIDDLVTKGTNEPYRMMTSRSEYRLILRQDNADLRLTEIGRRVGLIDDARYAAFLEKKEAIERECERLKKTTVAPSAEVNRLLVSLGSTPISTGVKLAELLKRPELDYEAIAPIDKCRPELPPTVRLTASVQIKYEGYIKRELSEVQRHKRLEERHIPEWVDY